MKEMGLLGFLRLLGFLSLMKLFDNRKALNRSQVIRMNKGAMIDYIEKL